MTLTHLIAAIHLMNFGLGFGACWMRATALQKVKSESDLKAVFTADTFWGIAAMIWIVTGLWRAFGGLEKGTDWYLGNTAFHIKMAFFILVIILEIKPMIKLIRWRIDLKKGTSIDLSAAPSLARISWIELGLLLPIVLMATAMERGIWY